MSTMTAENYKELLDEYDNAYYNLDDPLISDEEYDALKNRWLGLLVANGEEESTVPGTASSKFDKVAHIYPITSLDKIHEKADLEGKMSAFVEGVVQPKLDGLTIVVYGKGTLHPDKAIWASRGDGHIGEDLTVACQKVPNLKAIDGIAYRAEVFMPKSKFDLANQRRLADGKEPFKNTRNAAAGMLRNLDVDKIDGLDYFAYNILGSTKTNTAQLELLKALGIKTVPSKKYVESTMVKASDFIMSFGEERKKLDYDTDGMVIKCDLENSLEMFGSTGHHPKDAVAFKYPTEGVWTTLTDIVWQVGRTGAVSPVAVFKPIDLLGSTVTRATLHNWAYLDAMGVHINDEVYVIKANEVIPRIMDYRSCQYVLPVNTTDGIVNKSISYKPEIPTRCPVCGELLTMEAKSLTCNNTHCPAKLVSVISHMGSKHALNIDGLSNKTIEKMFSMGMLNHKMDLFHLTAEQIAKLDGYTINSATKLYDKIQAALVDVPFDKALYASGVPTMGRTASKDISKAFRNVDELIHDVIHCRSAKLVTIPGIGEVMAGYIAGNLMLIEEMFSTIKSINYPSGTVVPAGEKKTFVITGALYKGTRDLYKDLIESKGHKLAGSVSKSTHYLVTNEESSTSKRIKADQLGIPIIDENALLSLLATL